MESQVLQTSGNQFNTFFPDFKPVFEETSNFSDYLLKMRRKNWDNSMFSLHYQAEELALSRGFEDLWSEPSQEFWRQNGFLHYPHQVETAKKSSANYDHHHVPR